MGVPINPLVLLPYVSDPEEFVLEGIKPLELVELAIKHKYMFTVLGDIDVSHYKPTKDNPVPSFRRIATLEKFIGSRYIKELPICVHELDLTKCGKDFLTPDVVWPEVIYVLNCAYAIQSLDVLFDKIPETVTEIIVEAKLIKPSVLMEDKEKLLIATKFANAYPNIIIRDPANKYELHSVLIDIAQQKIDTTNKKQKEQSIQEKETILTSKKIDGQHIDVNDILELCQKDEDINGHNLSEDDLKRQIRFVLNSSDLEKTSMTRQDGVNVNCVDYSTWPVVRRKILDLLKVKKAGDKFMEKRSATNTEPKPEPISQQINKEKTTKEREPIDIQKYISDSLLKKIKKSSGQDKFKNILLAINEINLDIIDDFNYQGGAKIIKNGTLTMSQTVKKENGCVLVQSCDSNANNDRKRLVWTMGDGPKGPVIVCMGFFEAHMETHKKYNPYKDCLRAASKRRYFSEKELSEYRNVNDILNDDQIDERNIIISNNDGIER